MKRSWLAPLVNYCQISSSDDTNFRERKAAEPPGERGASRRGSLRESARAVARKHLRKRGQSPHGMRAEPARGVVATLIAATFVLLPGCGAPEERPPNVVLLMLDTTRADRLGVYSSELPAGLSPELDARARGGVLFTNAISTSPWTRPSIGSLLSGRPARELGLYKEKGDALRDEVQTLPECLKAGGWRTIGLTANPNINRAFNFHQGFDEYVDSSLVWDWMNGRANDEGAEGEEDGDGDGHNGGLVPARDLYRRAMELVSADHDGPTYLQLNVMDVHEWTSAETARPEFRDLYKDRKDRTYLQTVRQASVDTEAFLRELLALPGWERTLLVITSDHGEGLWDHPGVRRSRLHGELLYRSQLHVPLIMTSTAGDLPAGASPDALVTLEDVMPTILAYVGLQTPDAVRGTSLLPLILGGEGPILTRPERAFVETRFRGHHKLGVVTPSWLYVVNRGKEHGGTLPEELQPWRAPQKGALTEVKEQYPDEVEELSRLLNKLDRELKSATPWVPEGKQTTQEIEQLKAMGYLQ